MKENPKDSKNRKVIITKNIVWDKFIGGVQGAEQFLVACGFKRETEGKGAKTIEHFVIAPEAVSDSILSKAVDLLTERQEDLNVVAKVPTAAGRKCKNGNCNFYGSTSEGLCSKCHAEQYSAPAAAVKKSEIKAPDVRCKNYPKCMFYGTNQGFCSACYRKYQEANPDPWQGNLQAALLKIKAAHKLADNIKPVQQHTNRCWKCNMKVGIVGIECRCRYIFCGKHRYADKHDCPYDHKKQQRRKLEKELELVVGTKFEKIEES